MLGQYFDILVLFVVVVLIFQRLKNVLGETPHVQEKKMSEEEAAKIFDLLMKEAEQKKMVETSEIEENSHVAENQETAQPVEEMSETDSVLNKIPNFDKNVFLSGAKRAFEVIVAAFAKGDITTLEKLVNHKLLQKFQDVIEQRHADGITAEMDFIGFDKAEIVTAKINQNNVAKIIVNFVSEQVNLLKNKQGDVIEGDDNFIQNISDTWTFERALTSSNPNWLLVSTKK